MMTRRMALATPLLASVSLYGCMHQPTLNLPEGQHALSLNIAGRREPVRLWLYLPKGYRSSTQAWPLLIFLHGSGERGSDLDVVKTHGPPKLVDLGQDLPFILASPQLEAGGAWDAELLHALSLDLQRRLRIDPSRVLATGLSLGGHGVWSWASRYPEDLAGIAPVCGYGDPAAVCKGRLVPVRAYHGDADTVVPLSQQQACVDALRQCGGIAKLIVFPGVGHDSWTPAYQDPALVPWLLSQRRG